MSKKNEVRMEIRYHKEKDKEMIDFIDTYGSTRAGFIKQVLKLYKTQVQASNMASMPLPGEENQTHDKFASKKTSKKKPRLGESFSSKKFDFD